MSSRIRDPDGRRRGRWADGGSRAWWFGLALLLTGCGEASAPPAHLRIAGSDPDRGKHLIYAYGCGLCHEIPGIRGARGTVGPPLDRYAERNLVAGILPNVPVHLIEWLMNPSTIAPRTGMPDMGITQTQARDIASYLYALNAAAVAVYPPDPPLALEGRERPALETPYPASGGYQQSGTAAGGGAGGPRRRPETGGSQGEDAAEAVMRGLARQPEP